MWPTGLMVRLSLSSTVGAIFRGILFLSTRLMVRLSLSGTKGAIFRGILFMSVYDQRV